MVKGVNNGFLIFPYTTTDWAIITVAISATVFKVILLYYNEPKVRLRDWISVIAVSYISTVGLYELAIVKKWDIGLFFIPFSVAIVISKDIADWLFLEEDGKTFVKETIRAIISKFLDSKIK